MNDGLDDLKTQVIAIWMDLLQVEMADPDDDFFASGGDSLQLIQLVVRISALSSTDFDYDSFFEEPTIRTLMELLTRQPDEPPFAAECSPSLSGMRCCNEFGE
jgi:aryl carrier-like protein